MRRGEIWWGAPRLPGGSGKRRPFLIVSHDAFNRNERYPKVLVVHLTTVKKGRGAYDWEIALPRGAANLPYASVIKCSEIYTLFKDHLEELVGTLSADRMEQVDEALSLVLALSPGVGRSSL